MKNKELAEQVISRESLLKILNELIANNFNGKAHCLCYLDIDNFRVVNHGHGTKAGDLLLKEISNLILGVLGDEHSLAWIYGDCFIIYFKDCEIEKAKNIIRTIRNEIKEYRLRWEKEILVVSASFGVIQLDKNLLADAPSMLLLAEEACNVVKLKGGDGVEAVAGAELSSIIKKQREEAKWVSRINNAFEEDRFLLYYQPIVSLNPAVKERHFEFLIRMINHEGELVSPNLFLNTAEKYELGVKIDSWVVKTAFSWMEAYSDLISENISWGINLSGQSLANKEFLDLVLEQFERKNIHHAKVYFEITETAAITNLENAIRFIDVIHGKGGR